MVNDLGSCKGSLFRARDGSFGHFSATFQISPRGHGDVDRPLELWPEKIAHSPVQIPQGV